MFSQFRLQCVSTKVIHFKGPTHPLSIDTLLASCMSRMIEYIAIEYAWQCHFPLLHVLRIGYACHTSYQKGTNGKTMSYSLLICHMQIVKLNDFRTIGFLIWITLVLIRTIIQDFLITRNLHIERLRIQNLEDAQS